MAKNIVICSDGTGNADIVGRGTNVFKLFEAVDLNGHQWEATLRPQVAFYDDGVGTESLKPLRMIGGAAGWGLSRNVRELYEELARVYDPGDSIYMFGFSRGAFTVRTLVGMIGTCGVLDRRKAGTASEFDRLVKKAYASYRACYRTSLSRLIRGTPTRDAGAEFRRAFAVEKQTRIRFLGVWDTVDAVGLPFHISDIINASVYRFKFPDPFLSNSVDRACHALSIDDERHSFHPRVWDESANQKCIEQVWFPGVHSNVGGGYPKHGLSLVALDWMMAKAEEAGLRFNCRDRDTYREHASVDDKLYDPRAGLGTFYRWQPRDIAKICRRNHMPARIHVSAIERIAHGVEHYAPENLPGTIEVVTTPPDRQQDPALVRERAARVEAQCNNALRGRSLLDGLRGTLLWGRLSYYLFLIACTAALLGIVGQSAVLQRQSVWSAAAALVAGTVTSPFTTAWNSAQALWAKPLLFWGVMAGLVLSSLLARVTDHRISTEASRFWYTQQPKLRDALKDARAEVLRRSPAMPTAACWGTAGVATSSEMVAMLKRLDDASDPRPGAGV